MLPLRVVRACNEKNGFATFDECIAANQVVPPEDYYHPGGRLGVWLSDTPYYDNVPGENGRGPTWALEKLVGPCETAPARD
jgi:hypothetical protein